MKVIRSSVIGLALWLAVIIVLTLAASLPAEAIVCPWTGANPRVACVSDASYLQQCLNEAAGDSAANVIRVQQGTYLGNFTNTGAEAFALSLFGGYNAGCTAKGTQATVLDGASAGTSLRLGITGDVHVEGFVIKNGSADYGGGLSVETAGNISLVNNIIYGNKALIGVGGGAYLTGGDIVLTNNTITNNIADNNGGGGVYANSSGTVDLANNIIWSNFGDLGKTLSDDMQFDAVTAVNVNNNDYNTLTSSPAPNATDNINSNPLFADPADGNYHIQWTSPCVDTGTSTGAPALDIDGNSRPVGSAVDMGADEVVIHNVTLESDKTSPIVTSTGITLTAQAYGGSGSYDYKFWVLNPTTGLWEIVQDYGNGNTLAWSSATAGRYIFTVYAKNAGSPAPFETLQRLTMDVMGAQPPTELTFLANKPNPIAVGELVTLTATASGGSGNYDYKFWIQNNTTGAWQLLQDYGNGNQIINWSSGVAGSYNFTAYARNLGSPVPYALIKRRTVVVGETPVSGLTVTADKPNPIVATEKVTLTATASGGTAPYDYQFWIQDLATGQWSMVQDYGHGNQLVEWSTLVGGTYNFTVYAKNAGSTANYEAIKRILVIVSSLEVTLHWTNEPVNKISAGGTVDFSASVNASGSFDYQFFTKDRNTGIWTKVQNYGNGNAWSWVNVPAGEWNVIVYAKPMGSPLSFVAINSMALHAY